MEGRPNRYSFFLTIAIFLFSALTLPVVLIIAQRQTQILSKAAPSGGEEQICPLQDPPELLGITPYYPRIPMGSTANLVGYDFSCEQGEVFLTNLRNATTGTHLKQQQLADLKLRVITWGTRAVEVQMPTIDLGTEEDIEAELYLKSATGEQTKQLTITLLFIRQLGSPIPIPTPTEE